MPQSKTRRRYTPRYPSAAPPAPVNQSIRMEPFSVLLSVYARERADYLRTALESVFAQTLQPSEVVLVEDGPLGDALRAVIDAFRAAHPATMRTLALKQNRGLGNALNAGLEACRNELVARMDTDDICLPQRFERQVALMASRPDIDISSSWIDEFEDTPSRIISQRQLPEQHDSIVHYAKTRCPVNHVAVIYRRSRVLALGGYQGFPEDYYLWVRMLQAGCRFHNLQESLVLVRFDAAALRRRGGWTYARHDLHAQWSILRTGFLTPWQFARNCTVRITVRLLPNNLRVWVYRHLLRTEPRGKTKA